MKCTKLSVLIASSILLAHGAAQAEILLEGTLFVAPVQGVDTAVFAFETPALQPNQCNLDGE